MEYKKGNIITQHYHFQEMDVEIVEIDLVNQKYITKCIQMRNDKGEEIYKDKIREENGYLNFCDAHTDMWTLKSST